MKILITGVGGFVGSHLAEHFVREGHDVSGLLRTVRARSVLLRKGIHKDINLHHADIRDRDEVRNVFASEDFDCVIHCAAIAIVKRASKFPSQTFITNVIGTLNVLECAEMAGVHKFIFQSTDKVYGEKMSAREDDAVVASGAYETSKACADLAVQSFMISSLCSGGRIDFIQIVRSCNIYGYDPYSPRIIPNTIKACMMNKSPIIYHEEGIPSQRQYLHISDLCAAYSKLLKHEESGIFNVGSYDVLTQEEVVKTILKFFPHIKPTYVEKEEKCEEIWAQSLAWDRMRLLGWKPRMTFEEGIKKTIEEFRELRW